MIVRQEEMILSQETEISSHEEVIARQEATILSQESEILGHKEVIARQEATLCAGDAEVVLTLKELAQLYVDIQKMISSKIKQRSLTYEFLTIVYVYTFDTSPLDSI